MNKPLWSASLSNGETLYEGKGNYRRLPGKLSPWERLLQHLQNTGATITSLSLYTDGGLRWNLPSAGKNPHFHEFTNAKKPISYKMFRKMGNDILGKDAGKEDLYTVAHAEYEGGHTVEIWVNDDTRASWSVLL